MDIGGLEIADTVVARQDDGEVGSLKKAVEGFEEALLEKFYVSYPSTRQLVARLQTSHTVITRRLYKYGTGPRA